VSTDKNIEKVSLEPHFAAMTRISTGNVKTLASRLVAVVKCIILSYNLDNGKNLLPHGLHLNRFGHSACKTGSLFLFAV